MLVGPGVNQPDGFPADIDAPTGGRVMISRSTDEALTWSKPETLWDTPLDDCSPNFHELSDGTILCSFYTYPKLGTMILRSTDGGQTWEQACEPLPGASDGPIIGLWDGSAMICVYDQFSDRNKEYGHALFRTADGGNTWEQTAVICSDHEMSERSIAQLESGRIVLVSRPDGDVCWSDDGGWTWTDPIRLGIHLFEPGLMALGDGTLLCIHGSYASRWAGLYVQPGWGGDVAGAGGGSRICRRPERIRIRKGDRAAGWIRVCGVYPHRRAQTGGCGKQRHLGRAAACGQGLLRDPGAAGAGRWHGRDQGGSSQWAGRAGV
ncbi:MAG: sialidase family protein [Candidatus Latescibacterota bacterium]